MKIAIASTGLGHVARGIETWALDTALALHERGVDVTLFCAEELRKAEGGKVKAEGGKEDMNATSPPLPVIVVHCWKRGDVRTRRVARLAPNFLWRWGLKNTYGIEQLTFWRSLRPFLVQGKFDILHVQDPMLAFWCARARKKGRVCTKEILGHGTEEPDWFLRRFDYLQQLAPWHLEQLRKGMREER